MPDYRHWIDTLAQADGRLYYRDQTPEALAWLADAVRRVAPTRIVELGTLAGLSLRCLVEASRDIGSAITSIDLSFRVLHEKAGLIPLDLSRVQLLERNILDVAFADLWSPEDRVLLYIDAHDQPGVPIMDHLLRTALPALPPGSTVIVDDLWHTPRTLTETTARIFFDEHVRHAIDPLQCFTGHFAPYHDGGSFMGFAEAVPLLRHVNAWGLRLDIPEGGKSVGFDWPPSTGPAASHDDPAWWGRITYNPLDAGPQATENDRQAAKLYQAGRFEETDAALAQGLEDGRSRLGAYAQAVCQARQGHVRRALRHLDQELEIPSPNPAARELSRDILRFLDRRDGTPSLTLFAMPKGFAGHIGLIQRNALTSWTRLTPRPRILLLGDDPGTAEIAAELGCDHIPDVPRNASGTPLVSGLFNLAARHAPHDVLAYVNADIILFDDFPAAVSAARRRHDRFLMVGRRYDMPLDRPLDFTKATWRDDLRTRLARDGIAHAACGLDYFVHTPGLWGEIPDFGLGRTVWDLWLLGAPLARGATVVDASDAATVIHQAHDYRHLANGLHEAYFGDEAAANQAMAGDTGVDWNVSCLDAPLALTPDGRLVSRPVRPPDYVTPAFKAQRRQWLENAVARELAEGKPDMARIHLEELALRFPDDADIATRFAALRDRLAAVDGTAA